MGGGGVGCWLMVDSLGIVFLFVYVCRNVSRCWLVLFLGICKIVRRDRSVLFLCVCKNVSRDWLVLFLCICKNVYSCWWVLCAYKGKKKVKILCPVSLYL